MRRAPGTLAGTRGRAQPGGATRAGNRTQRKARRAENGLRRRGAGGHDGAHALVPQRQPPGVLGHCGRPAVPAPRAAHHPARAPSRRSGPPGPRRSAPVAPLFGWWQGPDGEVSAAFLHTPPFGVALTSVPAPAAAALAEALATRRRTGERGERRSSRRGSLRPRLAQADRRRHRAAHAEPAVPARRAALARPEAAGAGPAGGPGRPRPAHRLDRGVPPGSAIRSRGRGVDGR